MQKMPVVFAQAGQWPRGPRTPPPSLFRGPELKAGVDRLQNTCRERQRAEETAQGAGVGGGRCTETQCEVGKMVGQPRQKGRGAGRDARSTW